MIRLKVLFFTMGNEQVASSRARVYQCLPYLRQQGIECRTVFYIAPWQFEKVVNMEKQGWLIRLCGKAYSIFKMAVFIALSPRYDILFIQRVLLPIRIYRLILLLKKKIIFDFDDAIYLADRWRRPFLSRNKFLKRFQYILAKSNCVIVSNETLEKMVSKFNANIIRLPTAVDTYRLTPSQARTHNERVVIGWIGSPEAAKYLISVKKPLELLAEKFPFLKIKLIGAIPLQNWKIDISVKQWSLEEEEKDLAGFDIGIMPLDNDEWSQGKAGYKLLQYMAVGIPCVASPVGVNCRLIEDGVNGFLAESPEEWQEKLDILIKDAGLRLRMGSLGRKIVDELYSYEVLMPKLIRAINDVSMAPCKINKGCTDYTDFKNRLHRLPKLFSR